jgi:hypothetical protein
MAMKEYRSMRRVLHSVSVQELAIGIALVWLVVSGLLVYGVYRAQFGRDVPPGTVVAFGGPLRDLPPGWLLCDGHEEDKYHRAELYSAIGDEWGGSGALTFRVPDLRGMFLRGAEGDKREPEWKDVGPRKLAHAGLDKEGPYFSVGTLQLSTGYLNEVHGGVLRHWVPGPPPPDVVWALAVDRSAVGVEVRPKNAAVNWIIKY